MIDALTDMSLSDAHAFPGAIPPIYQNNSLPNICAAQPICKFSAKNRHFRTLKYKHGAQTARAPCIGPSMLLYLPTTTDTVELVMPVKMPVPPSMLL